MNFNKFYSTDDFSQLNHRLIDMINYTNPGTLHTSVFVRRVKGELKDICHDVFYVADDNGKCASRLWNGWGRHHDSIGNFGDFHTLDDYRGQGLGGKLLNMWYEDIADTNDKPIGLFCTSAKMIAKTYEKYGMFCIIPGEISGPSYMPLGDSPKKFIDVCDMYYTSSNEIIEKDATFEYRHEIDLLLKFYFIMNNMNFGFSDIQNLEQALIVNPENTKLYFAKNGHCIGWKTGVNIQLHPKYSKSDIIIQ